MNFELFAPEVQSNILPYDGVVEDFGLILTAEQSEQYLQYFLSQLRWQADEVFLFGQHHVMQRQVVWYADENDNYRYSGSIKQAQHWDRVLWDLKQQIEQRIGHVFNSCLANLYAHGSQGLGWHSDDEASLVSKTDRETVIASLSLGVTRKFSFKHKQNATKVDVFVTQWSTVGDARADPEVLETCINEIKQDYRASD